MTPHSKLIDVALLYHCDICLPVGGKKPLKIEL